MDRTVFTGQGDLCTCKISLPINLNCQPFKSVIFPRHHRGIRTFSRIACILNSEQSRTCMWVWDDIPIVLDSLSVAYSTSVFVLSSFQTSGRRPIRKIKQSSNALRHPTSTIMRVLGYHVGHLLLSHDAFLLAKAAERLPAPGTSFREKSASPLTIMLWSAISI